MHSIVRFENQKGGPSPVACRSRGQQIPNVKVRLFMLVKNTVTGAQEHVPSNALMHSLIKMGLLELVTHDVGDPVKANNGAIIPTMEPPAVPQWSVAMVRTGSAQEEFPAIVFRVGTSVYERWCGEPQDAHQGFGRRVVPHTVIKEYAELYKQWAKGKKK
jgi:hypothetical protein